MEINIEGVSGTKSYYSIINLVIKIDDVKITYEILPYDSYRVDDLLLQQLRNVLSILEEHNNNVDSDPLGF